MQDGPMIETETKLCLEVVSGEKTELRPFNYTKNLNQLWRFENYSPAYYELIKNLPFVPISSKLFELDDISSVLNLLLPVESGNTTEQPLTLFHRIDSLNKKWRNFYGYFTENLRIFYG